MIRVIVKGKIQTMIGVAIPNLQKVMIIDVENIVYLSEEYGLLEISLVEIGEIDNFIDIVEDSSDIALLVNDGNEYLEYGANDEVGLHWNINVDYGNNTKGDK